MSTLCFRLSRNLFLFWGFEVTFWERTAFNRHGELVPVIPAVLRWRWEDQSFKASEFLD